MIEIDGYTFEQSEVIQFQYHCVELRITIAKQAAEPAPWCAWEVRSDPAGVVFLKSPSGDVATYEKVEDCARAAIKAKFMASRQV